MIRKTYRKQGDGVVPYDYYTVQNSGRGYITLYGWGVYGNHSVLAGQQMKQSLAFFDTEDELVAALNEAGIPREDVQWSSPLVERVISYNHLPDGPDW